MIGEMLWSSGELWINCGNGRILFCPGGRIEGVQMGPEELVDPEGNTVGWTLPSVADERDFPRPLPGYHWKPCEASPPHNKRALDNIHNTPVGQGWIYTIEKDDDD